MEQAHWNRLQQIYHQAVALPPQEREAFLESACAPDLNLLREVQALLKAVDSCGGILDCPVVELGSASVGLVGTTIGNRYFVESELTHGGMSQVYLANDLRLPPQQVVIKVLSPKLIDNPYAQRKFDQEIEALLRMEHPHVVRVLDRGELTDARPYIVMPYIDGVSLRSQIPNQGMDLVRASAILKQIGLALDHVHDHGIIHRDLKPENIMLRRGTDSVVLIDFGIANLRASLIAPSTLSAIAGTLPYMSPEQLRGETLTRVSDVYSMGVVAYEIVTGRCPFKPASASQMLDLQRARIRVSPKQLREEISVEADRAIIRALKFEPRARYQGAGEFGDQLSNTLVQKTERKPLITGWVKLLTGLIIIGFLSYGVYKKVKVAPPPSQPSSSPTTPASHTFTYFLTVQKVRGGREYREPYKSNGEEDIFESGDRFQLNITAAEPGYLYVFHEGSPENDAGFTMLFPRKELNNRSAAIGSNQVLQSDWITFRGPAGVENVWIVWSLSPVPELESAKTETFLDPRAGLSADNLGTVRTFLTKPLEPKTTVFHYKETQKAIARSKGNLLIAFAQLKHH
jgi:serine/threonine protein kinase